MGSGVGKKYMIKNNAIVEVRYYKIGFFIGGYEEIGHGYRGISQEEVDRCMNCTLPENCCERCNGDWKKVNTLCFENCQTALF